MFGHGWVMNGRKCHERYTLPGFKSLFLWLVFFVSLSTMTGLTTVFP